MAEGGIMKRYQKGKRVTNINQLEGTEFIYFMDKVYHHGWWGSWQYRLLKTWIERGAIWKAIKIEEDKD